MSTVSAEAPVRQLRVRCGGGERYVIAVRGHDVLVDQPIDDGGEDLAPSPVELFVAALAGCVAYYAGRYLSRHNLSRAGLIVQVTYRMASDPPARVGAIDLAVTAPALPASRRPAMQAVIERCTVHNSLVHPPAVNIALAA